VYERREILFSGKNWQHKPERSIFMSVLPKEVIQEILKAIISRTLEKFWLF